MKYILSVTEINRYLKELISRDLVLTNLWVKGEISNFKNHYSGHMYFTVKDENSLLKCIMFKTHNMHLKFVPENGMKVILKGYISVFERDGQYQLYAEDMQPDGVGSLHIAFEQLKNKLQNEGLFEKERKRKIPMLPQAVAVVTSPTGAVIRDIINVSCRRFENVQLKLFPVAVQGEGAAKQIAAAIKKINQLQCADVIIVARGGGSLEELWAFNEEIVARSIFESQIPVISAIGHETDFTIADFVADLRAPTPSAAAEIAIPHKAVLNEKIVLLRERLKTLLLKNVDQQRSQLQRVLNSVVFKQPYNRIYQERMKLDGIDRNLQREIQIILERKRARLHALIGKLDSLSPLTILSRGYSVVKTKQDGCLLKSVQRVAVGDGIEIEMSDGRLLCTIDAKEVSENYENE